MMRWGRQAILTKEVETLAKHEHSGPHNAAAESGVSEWSTPWTVLKDYAWARVRSSPEEPSSTRQRECGRLRVLQIGQVKASV